MLTTLAIIIIVYILVAVVYVVARTTVFPGLGNGVTMYDYPFMALMVSLTVVLIGRCVDGKDSKEHFTCAPTLQEYAQPRFEDVPLPEYAGSEYVPGFYRPPGCGPEYRRQDEIQAARRKKTVSPLRMSPEELGRNPREVDLYFHGEGMDEISDYATRESLKRARARRDSKLNSYTTARDLFDIAHRDESYRDAFGHANGAPYEPVWWDNDRY